jgi:hypothetical protein
MSIPTSIFNQIRTIVSEMKHIRTLEVEIAVCMNTSSLRVIASCISFKGRTEFPRAKFNHNSFECMIFDNYTARLISKFYKKNIYSKLLLEYIGSTGSTSDFYSRGSRFKSVPGHGLSQLE